MGRQKLRVSLSVGYLLIGVKRRIIGGHRYAPLSGNQEDPITSIEKKGKEEIYLGLEIVAVTEYPTHDEDGGLAKKKEERDEGICLAGGEGYLYMYTNQANIKSTIKKKA